MTIWEIYPDHPRSQEFENISRFLDQHPCFLDWAIDDLCDQATKPTGRNGLSADSIIRAGIVKQMMGFSYEELAFFIADSYTIQAFTRISAPFTGRSALQNGISKISPATWEKINRTIILDASYQGVEKGRVTRTDTTVVESNIHAPTDSSLLFDGVRAITNLLQKKAPELTFRDHTRAAKKHAQRIGNMRKGKKQKKTYRTLMGLAKKSLSYLAQALEAQPDSKWREKAEELLALVASVIGQTYRRVIEGETVPAIEKVFSIFEPHTDIIKKGGRRIQYGHKVNLTTGRTGLIIDMVVEEGNPADSTTTVRMVKRQTEIYGRPPRQVCFDGCYGSIKNLNEIKELGVKDVAFNKKRGLKIDEMAKSSWVYKKLSKFRAGVEGNIGTLKQRYGWYRALWRGIEGFKAYVWLSVVANNLVTLSRLE